jgi:hypothetical protein
MHRSHAGAIQIPKISVHICPTNQAATIVDVESIMDVTHEVSGPGQSASSSWLTKCDFRGWEGKSCYPFEVDELSRSS